jgi:hypothetical protein
LRVQTGAGQVQKQHRVVGQQQYGDKRAAAAHGRRSGSTKQEQRFRDKSVKLAAASPLRYQRRGTCC